MARLVDLQSIDDEARGFVRERNDLEGKIRRLKELLQLMNQGLEEKKAKLVEASRWYGEKDAELKIDHEKVVKAKAKLQTVTKNKEYMAMQKEIESLRKANAAREEEILKLDEAMQEFNKSIATEEAKIADLESEVATEEATNAERIGELDKAIKAIDSRKAGVTDGLKRALLSRYRRIFDARDGLAVVPARKNACSGCNFAVPPQQMVRLHKLDRGDSSITKLETCRNCSRILYLGVEPEEDGDSEGVAAGAA